MNKCSAESVQPCSLAGRTQNRKLREMQKDSLASVQSPEAASFHFETRQFTGLRHRNDGVQRESAVDGLFYMSAHVLCIMTGHNFDLHFEIMHFLLRRHGHLVLADGGKLADHIFNSRGINIHATNGDHIISAPKQPSIEARKRPSTRTWRQIQPN